jgi:hypothetical protein
MKKVQRLLKSKVTLMLKTETFKLEIKALMLLVNNGTLFMSMNTKKNLRKEN